MLRVTLPPSASTGVQSVRMLVRGERRRQELAALDRRRGPIVLDPGRPGKEAVAVLEQNADALEYTGFFKKKMKNVELFEMSLLSTELKD